MQNLVKGVITKLKLRWSDLFLILWFFLGLLIFYESNRLTLGHNLTQTNTPFWLLTPIFVIVCISFFIYLYLEKRNRLNKYSIILLFVLLHLIIAQGIAIFLTPNIKEFYILDYYDEPFLITTILNIQTKITHFYTIIYLLFTFYAGIFVFPTRIQSIRFISVLIYIYFGLAFIFFVCSIFMDDYISFFKAVFACLHSKEPFPELSIVSVFGNKNTYGLFIEIGIFLGILNYLIDHRKINIIFTSLMYLHSLVVFCKSAIVLTTIFIVLLIPQILIKNTKYKKRVVLILSSIIIASAVALSILSFVLVNTDEYLKEFNQIFQKEKTFKDRGLIWGYSIQLFKQSSPVIGSGFGIYNTNLFNSCYTIGGLENSTTHMWFLSILCRGGLFMLLAYMFLLIYSVYIAFISYKDKPNIVITLIMMEAALFFHSFLEDYSYIVLSVIIILCVMCHIKTNCKQQNVVSSRF